jgi:hypothetical protein
MEKHEITNDLALDAVKDNFKPPKMGEMKEENLVELFERLNLDIQYFYDYVYKSSEYYTDHGEKSYLIKDVAKVIKVLTIKE